MKTFSNIKGDLFGGLSAGVVALPVALAFGAASGLEPVNGLYGAIILGFIAAFIGGTQTLISNPTGPMAVLSAIIIAEEIQIHGSLNQALPFIVLTFFLAGLIQALFGVMKLGKYVSYIPYPVISGFMTGIGMIIIIMQLPTFFGINEKHTVLSSVQNLPHFLTEMDPVSVVLAVATIVITYIVPKFTKAIPSTVVALVIVSIVSYFLGLDVRQIGHIPSDLPQFQTSIFTDLEIASLGHVFLPALSLAGLGMVDSLLTSVVADNLTQTRHNPNRELIGQGIGNMFGGLFGGIPGAGTTPATVLNIKSGARTHFSGMTHAVILFLILIAAGPIAAKIPYAVLSGILMTVGVSVFDLRVIKDLKYIPKSDLFIIVVVLVLTVFWDLLYAVAIGLIIAALYFMKKMADVVERETQNHRTDRIVNNIINTFSNAEDFKNQVEIISLTGPLFFGFASRFQDKIDALPIKKAVIFDFSNVYHLDQSGAYTFRDACKNLKNKGVNVCVCSMHWRQEKFYEGISLIPNVIDQKHIFGDIEEAVLWLNEPGHLINDFKSDDDLYIPSVFTPNGDGIGDVWEIRNIEKYPNCSVIVYTRSNILIYESLKGYKNDWSGKNLRGKEVPDGTYNYEIDLLGDGSDVRSGSVSIFR